ncbi:unnamed protein product [Boreogadus saida]
MLNMGAVLLLLIAVTDAPCGQRAEVNTRARVKMTVGITAWHHYKSAGWRSSFAFREEAAKVKSALVGTTQLVLVEGITSAISQSLRGRALSLGSLSDQPVQQDNLIGQLDTEASRTLV